MAPMLLINLILLTKPKNLLLLCENLIVVIRQQVIDAAVNNYA